MSRLSIHDIIKRRKNAKAEPSSWTSASRPARVYIPSPRVQGQRTRTHPSFVEFTSITSSCDPVCISPSEISFICVYVWIYDKLTLWLTLEAIVSAMLLLFTRKVLCLGKHRHQLSEESLVFFSKVRNFGSNVRFNSYMLRYPWWRSRQVTIIANIFFTIIN